MELNVNIRSWEKTSMLIKQWLVPAIVYGKSLTSPITITCNKNEFIKKYKEAGYSTPITLKWKDIDQMVLIQDIQLDPVSDYVIHIDFLAISQDQKVKTEIPIVLTWESQIEKLWEWKIQLIKDFVQVEALPQDLPHNFVVDISGIQAMNDVIFLRDIKVWDQVEIVEDMDQPIVTVLKLAEESEEKSTSTEVAKTEDKAPNKEEKK